MNTALTCNQPAILRNWATKLTSDSSLLVPDTYQRPFSGIHGP